MNTFRGVLAILRDEQYEEGWSNAHRPTLWQRLKTACRYVRTRHTPYHARDFCTKCGNEDLHSIPISRREMGRFCPLCPENGWEVGVWYGDRNPPSFA
jgi:hypothetical protein